MKKIIEIPHIKIVPKQILDNMNCYEDSPAYEASLECLEEMEELFRKTIKTMAAWDYLDIDNMDFLTNSEQAVATLYTIGVEISEVITELFNKGDYLGGVIMDTLSDYYLMEIDKEVSKFLGKKFAKENINTTKRFVPFEEISHTYQKTISDKIDLGITVTTGFMLNPAKSGSFIFGIGKNIKNESILHNCARCGNINCKFREVDDMGNVMGQNYFNK